MTNRSTKEPGRAQAGQQRAPKRPPLVIGWREIVSLPDLGLVEIKAKIDTGARTTALHASKIKTYTTGGQEWVSFHPRHAGLTASGLCHAPVHDRRAIRNTSGVPEDRIIIRTTLSLADREFLIEVSLADRADMAFPIIIGRTAMRGHRLLVNCGRSWLTRPNPRGKTKKQRKTE